MERSHEDKTLFPEVRLTKGDLIDYYAEIAPVMLPHLKDRPVTMHRFPNGIESNGFFQKDIPDYFPDWVDRETVSKEGGRLTQLLCGNAATLVYLANQATITPHVWLSRRDKPELPDLMAFDLDPSDDGFVPVRRVARALLELLESGGMPAYLKTSGSRGLHVVTPLKRRHDFDAVRAYAQRIANRLAEDDPEHVTVEQRKAKRGGRVFVDVARNAYAQTIAPPYAVRPRPRAPVSAPIDWDELADEKLDAQRYHIGNIRKRLAQKSDPWEGMMRHAVSLPG